MSDEALTDRFATLDLAALTREAERLGYVREAGSHGFRWHDGYSRVLWSLGAAIWWSAPHRTHDDEAAALRWLLRQPEALARAACGEHEVTRG